MTRWRFKSVEFDGPAVPQAGFNGVPLAGASLGPVWLTGAQLAAIAEPVPLPPPVVVVPPTPAPGGTEWGVVFVGNERESAYRDAAAAGAKWALLRVIYDRVSVPPTTSDWWGWPDVMVSSAQAAGLRVALRWWWWHPTAQRWGDVSAVGYPDVTSLAVAIASRYRDRVALYQPDNEPDHTAEPYAATLAPARFRVAVAGIRRGYPSAQIVSPGLAYYKPTPEQRAVVRGIQNAAAELGTHAAMHYYPSLHPEGFAAKLRAFRSETGYTGPVVVTETGEHTNNGEAAQAAMVSKAAGEIKAAGVPLCCVYRCQDEAADASRPPHTYGLWTADGRAKQSLAAFRTAVRGQ
jgi:hypothetical protein